MSNNILKDLYNIEMKRIRDLNAIQARENQKRRERERISREERKALIKDYEEQTIEANKVYEKQTEERINFNKLYEPISDKEKDKYLNFFKNKIKKELVYNFKKKEPLSIEEFFKVNRVGKKNFVLDKIKPSRVVKRNERISYLTKEYKESYLIDFYNEQEELEKEYKNTLEQKNNQIRIENSEFEKLENNLANFKKKEVETIVNEYLKENTISFTLQNLAEEKEYELKCKANYYEKNKCLSIESLVLDPIIFWSFPKKIKLNKTTLEPDYFYFTDNQYKKMYESHLKSYAVLLMYNVVEVFEKYIDEIIVNLYANGTNPYNGKNEKIFMLSTRVYKKDLININIKNVNCTEFLKRYECRLSNDFSNFVGIEPISYEESQNNYSLENISNNLDGFQFEHLSKNLLLSNGFDKVEVTKASGDYGADVIAYKEEIKYAIQCKKFSSTVGVKAVQEVIGSMSIYKCHVGVVLTNNYFTPQARELADKNNILLWDRDKLLKMLEKMK